MLDSIDRRGDDSRPWGGLRHGALAVLAVLAGVVAARAETIAFVNAAVIPVTAPEIEEGHLLVRDGRIASVGPMRGFVPPADATVVDLRGRTIMPGLVDTHSHIGGWGGADRSGPIQPDARILDAINVRDSGFRRAVAGGLTTLNIMPGSGHLLSGQTVYVKLRTARTIDDLLIRDADGVPMGGIKMANGTNPQGAPPFPGTRSKAASLVRQRYIEAQEYGAKIERAAGDPAKMPPRDLGLEALLEALHGTRIVHFHTHRHDDILTVLRLKEEFGLRVVLHHVSDGWKVAPEIAAADVPCSIILVDSPGGKLEAIDVAYRTGKVLDEAGVLVAYHTDDWITDSRHFLRSPALGIRAGLSRAAALASVTINGARMLDLGDRIGSLEPGKDADFVVLDGDPFSIRTRVRQTWVEGVKVFDLENPDDRLHAEGGYGAGHDQQPYLCCEGGEQGGTR